MGGTGRPPLRPALWVLLVFHAASGPAPSRRCEDDGGGLAAAAAELRIPLRACSEAAHLCEDGDFGQFLRRHCPRACRTCDGAPDCADQDALVAQLAPASGVPLDWCAAAAPLCRDGLHGLLVQEYCPRTCGACADSRPDRQLADVSDEGADDGNASMTGNLSEVFDDGNTTTSTSTTTTTTTSLTFTTSTTSSTTTTTTSSTTVSTTATETSTTTTTTTLTTTTTSSTSTTSSTTTYSTTTLTSTTTTTSSSTSSTTSSTTTTVTTTTTSTTTNTTTTTSTTTTTLTTTTTTTSTTTSTTTTTPPCGAEIVNLALGLLPTGSSQTLAGQFKAATDGDDDTVWRALPGDYPGWLALDLGAPAIITGMSLVGGDPGFKVLKTYRSDDGRDWTMVSAVDTPENCGAAGNVTAHGGFDRPARYVLIQMEDRCEGVHVGQFSLAEWNVFGHHEQMMVLQYAKSWPICDDLGPCFTYRDLKVAQAECLADEKCDGFSFSSQAIAGGRGGGCFKRGCRIGFAGRNGFGRGTHGYWVKRHGCDFPSRPAYLDTTSGLEVCGP